MDAISVAGHVNEEHQLFAVVPNSIPAGPVTVLVVRAAPEDDGGEAWPVHAS